MPKSSLTLDDQSSGAIERIVAGGRYVSASSAVRAGLELLEAEEIKLQRLREALIKGENSGIVEDFDFDAFLAEQQKTWPE